MEWSLFAILQTVVMAIAVSTAFWLRNRQLTQQNEQLRAHIDTLQVSSPATEDQDPSTWVAAKIADIPADSPFAPLLKLVLQHQLEPQDNFAEQVAKIAAECGLTGAEDSQITELEAALEATRAELAEVQAGGGNAGGGDDAQSEELKNLLQQYTKDSRDMMSCIQTLEKENAELLSQLQAEGQTPADDASESNSDKQATNTDEAEPPATHEPVETRPTENATPAAEPTETEPTEAEATEPDATEAPPKETAA